MKEPLKSTAFELEILARAAITSPAYRQAVGVENLAEKYCRSVDDKHIKQAIEIVLDVRNITQSSPESIDLANWAVSLR
jgi:hypothetical protein